MERWRSFYCFCCVAAVAVAQPPHPHPPQLIFSEWEYNKRRVRCDSIVLFCAHIEWEQDGK